MISPVAPTNERTRTCRYCFRRQPISEFRRRAKGSDVRELMCRRCHNKAERQRRELRKLKRSKRAMARFNQHVARESNHNAIAEFVRSLLQEFGGLEATASAWLRHFQESKLGGKDRGNAFVAVAKLIAASEAVHQEVVEEMTDQELLEHSERLRTELLDQMQRSAEQAP